MASPVAEYEGTWEEIAMHAPEFRGHRLRLLVLADEPSPALSLEERPRRLAEQAEDRAEHYERDTEWREFLAGDIVEYGDPDA